MEEVLLMGEVVLLIIMEGALLMEVPLMVGELLIMEIVENDF